jgi:Fe2+ transport system protein FeoA
MTNTNNRLIHFRQGDRVRIASFEGGPALGEKFVQYGVFPGDEAQVLRIAPFDGPMLLEIGGREIALGKSIAACIIVEPCSCALP